MHRHASFEDAFATLNIPEKHEADDINNKYRLSLNLSEFKTFYLQDWYICG
jgi:hypothetical protein